MGLITATDFDALSGPSVSTTWSLHPAPKPIPNFEKVLAYQKEENWLPAHLSGDILPFSRRLLFLNPRDGFQIDRVCDAWSCFLGNERMDAEYLAVVVDTVPSMPDTLLQNGAAYDARKSFKIIQDWDSANPGVPTELTNTLEEAMQAKIFNNSLTMDIGFKQGAP
jgi:hypothetical protein